MTVTTLLAELGIRVSSRHGEGAWWDVRDATLLWVDMVGHAVHRSDPVSGADRSWAMPDTTAAVVGTDDDALLVLLGSGLARLDPASGAVDWIERLDGHGEDLRLNDGACDPAGRFVVGSKTRDRAARPGGLWVFADGRPLRRIHDGMGTSNGIAWSADGRWLYVVDSASRAILICDYDQDDGRITAVADRIQTQGPGAPDGMTIDAAGRLWVAMYGAGEIHRIDSHGRVDTVVEVPVSGVTSCTFGGADARDLYITTSPYGLDSVQLAAQADAGGIFVCRTPYDGTVDRPYRGSLAGSR